jgi:hypothetical protein
MTHNFFLVGLGRFELPTNGFGTVVLDNAHTTFGVDNVHSSSEQKPGDSP